MSAQLLEDMVAEHPELVTLTLEQYHQMLQANVLAEGEPIELLNGILVKKDRGPNMTVNPLHALIVNRLMKLAPDVESLGCHLRLQNPISIPPNHEPEPDGAIVNGAIDDYLQHHPGPGDTICVIEVADSSLEHDRNTKQRIYATAGIAFYMIANLVERRVELYEKPDTAGGRYERISLFKAGDRIALDFGHGRKLSTSADLYIP